LSLLLPLLISSVASLQAQTSQGALSVYGNDFTEPRSRVDLMLRRTIIADSARNSLLVRGEFALSPNFSIGAGVPILRVDSAGQSSSGVGDGQLGFLHRMYDGPEEFRFRASWGIDFTFPTGNPNIGTGRDQYLASPFLVTGFLVHENVDIYPELRYNHSFSDEDERFEVREFEGNLFETVTLSESFWLEFHQQLLVNFKLVYDDERYTVYLGGRIGAMLGKLKRLGFTFSAVTYAAYQRKFDYFIQGGVRFLFKPGV
jgi:hypothetical protein